MNGMITHWARVVTTIKNSLLRPPQGATPDSVSTLLPLQPPHSKHPRYPGLTSLLLLMGLLFTPLAHALDQVTYYHLDALGSPVAASDEQGNLIWRKDYQPYGEETQTPPQTHPETRGYTGHPYDANSGLVYMGARWYSPLAGRFMAVDPQGFSPANPQSFNRYGYANNNPYKFVDPDGREFIFLFGETGVGVDPLLRFGVEEGMLKPSAALEAAESVKAGTEAVSQGASRNKVEPIRNADAEHTTWKADPQTGKITRHETWKPNPRNPSGWDKVRNTDMKGSPHFNKQTKTDIPTPHTQGKEMSGKEIPGGVRPATPSEVPKGNHYNY